MKPTWLAGLAAVLELGLVAPAASEAVFGNLAPDGTSGSAGAFLLRTGGNAWRKDIL